MLVVQSPEARLSSVGRSPDLVDSRTTQSRIPGSMVRWCVVRRKSLLENTRYEYVFIYHLIDKPPAPY